MVEMAKAYVRFFIKNPERIFMISICVMRILTLRGKTDIKSRNSRAFDVFKEAADKYMEKLDIPRKKRAVNIIRMWVMVQGITMLSAVMPGIKCETDWKKYQEDTEGGCSMTLVIHDMDETAAKAFDFKDAEVIKNNGKIRNCIGCFGCWTRTPGECIRHDGYENMGKLLSKCDRLIIISRSCFGGYSPFVKNVFDRSISYVLPDFEMRGGEMHHKRRYDNVIAEEPYVTAKTLRKKKKRQPKTS